MSVMRRSKKESSNIYFVVIIFIPKEGSGCAYISYYDGGLYSANNSGIFYLRLSDTALLVIIELKSDPIYRSRLSSLHCINIKRVLL